MTIRRETAVNNAATTVNEALDNSETVITVSDGSVFPATGDFRVLVDAELMLCTSRSVNDLTVVRGVEGSAAVTHNTSAPITAVWTAGGIIDTVTQLDVIGGGSAQGGGELVRVPFRLLNKAGVTLTASDFTWIGQVASTATDEAWGGITFKIVENTGDWKLFYKAAPSAPYKVTAHVTFGPGCIVSSVGSTVGIGFNTSVDDKFLVGAMELGDVVKGWRFNSPSSFSASIPGDNNVDFDQQSIWLQIEDDNTNLKFRFSLDGVQFYEFASDGRTTFISGAPNRIAVIFRATQGQTNRFIHLNSWIEE